MLCLYHALELLGHLAHVVEAPERVGDGGEERLSDHGHGGLGLVQRLHDVEHARMTQPHEARGVSACEVEERVLRRPGEPGPRPRLGERALVEHPNGDDGVRRGCRRVPRPRRVDRSSGSVNDDP